MPAPYEEFFLRARADAIQLDLLEITHPAFTKAYRIVRNARDGVVVNLGEPGMGAVQFDYYPARVRRVGATGDLDASIKIDLGDLGEVLPVELDAVAAAGAFSIKPKVRYWTFRSDDLTGPIFGPLVLEVTQIAHSQDGASFEAKAASLNMNRTGELYRLERFPMLAPLI